MPEIRVLVADDEPLARRGVRQLLAAHTSFTVVGEARNGPETLLSLRTLKPDLLFLDIQMPEMDGFAASEAIRTSETGTGRHIPIIALTAAAFDGERDRCLRSGMDDYLAKPVRKDHLASMLQRWLNQNTSAPIASSLEALSTVLQSQKTRQLT